MQENTLGIRNRCVLRARRRRSARGLSLIEIVVVVAIIAMVSAGIAVAVEKIRRHAAIELMRTNAQAIRSGVKVWWSTGGDSTICPTVAKLITDGAVDKGKLTKADAWGQPWQIKCEDADVTVTSLGPDKQAGTEDDIIAPES